MPAIISKYTARKVRFDDHISGANVEIIRRDGYLVSFIDVENNSNYLRISGKCVESINFITPYKNNFVTIPPEVFKLSFHLMRLNNNDLSIRGN
jgi:hypothetical protein